MKNIKGIPEHALFILDKLTHFKNCKARQAKLFFLIMP